MTFAPQTCDCPWLKAVLKDRDALQGKLKAYGKHLDACGMFKQMPQEIGRTYMWPTDWDKWRASLKCTCGFDEALAQIEVQK